MIRIILPAHLRTLARVDGEVKVAVAAPVTLRSALDALEATYPMLRGTIRDQVTQQRRAPGHHAVRVDFFKQVEPILKCQPLV